MTSSLFKEHYQIDIEAAIAKYRAASQIDHKGLRGRAREIFVSDILQKVLPPDVVTGSGKIVDSIGGMWAQCDVVVYGKRILPPLMLDLVTGLFSIEACLYAVEVKSTLTASELDSSVKGFRRLLGLRPIKEALRPIPVLFAFDTDLSGSGCGKSELDRYAEKDPDAYTQPAISVICVAGRGYWWFSDKDKGGDGLAWRSLPSQDYYQEVLAFVGRFANTIYPALDDRAKVPFGKYVLEEHKPPLLRNPNRMKRESKTI